ncbi:hypothetical protein P7584_15575, partial [Staphylococcus aureus]|nr:hypothetical protein [Staphylococcus aureus]
EELLTIYEWPEKLLNKELKKLAIQQKIEKLKYPDGDFWKSKINDVVAIIIGTKRLPAKKPK